MGQLRRFTVQNGKGQGVGVIGARLKLVFVLNCQSINITLAVLGKLDLNWLCQQVVPRMCLGFRQAVCTGFQICEHTGDFAVALRCGGNGTCVFVIEFIGSIYLLRFSFVCCIDQLFQLELNIFQEYFFVIFAFFRVLLDDIQYKLRVLQRVGQLNLAAAAGDGSIGGCGWRCSCAVRFAVRFAVLCCFSRYNIRIAANRNGSVCRCLFKFVILYRTFHNAVHIIDVVIIRIDLVLIQTAKGTPPAAFTVFNGNIVFRVVSRVVYRCPVCIALAGCQAALELDVDLSRPLRSAKIVRTICIFPELIELNVDQFALGVGKDCGNFQIGRIVRLFALHNHAFHHGVVLDQMGFIDIRNGYALQSGTTIFRCNFLDGIAGANGDAGDGHGVVWVFYRIVHVDLNIPYDVIFFQTLTANIIKGNFELVGAFNDIVLTSCGLLLDFQPAGFDGVDVFYL